MTPIQFTAQKFMGVVTFRGEHWQAEFPEEKLPSWIAFYERMSKRYGHKSPSYASALSALRKLT